MNACLVIGLMVALGLLVVGTGRPSVSVGCAIGVTIVAISSVL
jgi:hypothetical protein